MKLNKSLTATVAAAALVGAIGVAYAQNTDNSTAPAGSTQNNSQMNSAQVQSPNGAAPMSQGTLNNSSTTPSTTSVDTPAFEAERPAQADRN